MNPSPQTELLHKCSPQHLIGTWYEHSVPVPDGTRFNTGISLTHPWWTLQGQWFHEGANEAVVGATLAQTYPGGIAAGKDDLRERAQ